MAVVPRISGIVRYEVYEGTRLDPAIAVSWGAEGSHWRVWDWNYVNQRLQKGVSSNAKYLELHLSVPPPFDNMMNEHMLDMIAWSWSNIIREGAPVRATMWYKANRWGPLNTPVLWHYLIFLEYHESPMIPIAAVIELLAMVFAVVIGLKMLGFDAGSVNKLVSAPFTGTTFVFILGIGFLVALAYFQERVKIPASRQVRVTAPKMPQVAPSVPLEMASGATRVARGRR
jgi:hypothetical protein